MPQELPYYDDHVRRLVRRNFSDIQKDEYERNMNDLGSVDKNLNTVRRQVQIIEDSSQRKGNTLFLLNVVLTALILSFIPVVLYMKGIIGYGVFSIIIIAITLLFVTVLFFNMLSVRKRTANRFSTRNFNTPEVMEEVSPPPTECPLTPAAQESKNRMKEQKDIQEINDLENEIKRLETEKKTSEESKKKLEVMKTELRTRYDKLKA